MEQNVHGNDRYNDKKGLCFNIVDSKAEGLKEMDWPFKLLDEAVAAVDEAALEGGEGTEFDEEGLAVEAAESALRADCEAAALELADA
eukprot:tig00021726_g23261.t1